MEIEAIEDAMAYAYDVQNQLRLLFPKSKGANVCEGASYVAASIEVAHDMDLAVIAHLPDPQLGCPFRLSVELHVCDHNECFWNFTCPLVGQEIYELVAPAVKVAQERILD